MRNFFIILISILALSNWVFAQNEPKPCPDTLVISPAEITNPGETITFSVKVKNETPDLKYVWAVSTGTIIEGQGTSTIRVATTPEMGGSTVVAKVIVNGSPSGCSNETSGNAAIASTIVCELMEDYGRVSSAMEKSMLDSLFSHLLNNPETIAYFQLRKDENETIKQMKNRIKRIIKHANFRKIDQRRFVFAVDQFELNSFGYLTSVYLIPENKEFPECKNCEVIRGEDVK